MELQILTGKYESSVGLLHPDLIEELGLTPEQTNEITELSEQYASSSSELLQTISDARDKIQKAFVDEAETILNLQQKKLYRKIVGGGVRKSPTNRR